MDAHAARTIVSGLLPEGGNVDTLSLKGRDEVRAALDMVLQVHSQQASKLELALRQLDEAAAEIKRLRLENARLRLAYWGELHPEELAELHQALGREE